MKLLPIIFTIILTLASFSLAFGQKDTSVYLIIPNRVDTIIFDSKAKHPSRHLSRKTDKLLLNRKVEIIIFNTDGKIVFKGLDDKINISKLDLLSVYYIKINNDEKSILLIKILD